MSEDNTEDNPNKVVVGDLELGFDEADVAPDDPQVRVDLQELRELEEESERIDRTGYGKKYVTPAQAGATSAQIVDKLRASGVTIKAVSAVNKK